jgi:hypothetical protein
VAHTLQNAAFTLGGVGTTRTLPRDAEVAKREIVLHRIVRVELAKRGRDLFGGGPGCGATIGEAEIAADAMDVRVHRDHELRGRNRPEAEIDAVRGTNHPPGIEDESLARTSGAGVADQVTQAATVGVSAKRVGETGQPLPEIPVASLVEVDKGVAEGLVLAEQLPGSREHRRQVLSPVDAVNEPPKAAIELVVARAHHSRRRFRAQHGEDAADATAGRYGISKREARGDEPHDLLVTRSVVAMDEIDWVPASSGLGVATFEQRVQVLADTVHFSRVLAILPSPLQ